MTLSNITFLHNPNMHSHLNVRLTNKDQKQGNDAAVALGRLGLSGAEYPIIPGVVMFVWVVHKKPLWLVDSLELIVES